MAQAQVDEWCIEAAKHHYVPVSDTQYGPVPREARGIPHQTFPGLHAYLDEYADAMERARTLMGIEDRRTVDSLQCLPLSPFAERQAPHVAEGSGKPTHTHTHTHIHIHTHTHTRARVPMRADPTVPKRFRNPDDAVGAEGRAFQVDATCPDVAILREPLVPCVAITSPQDCIFGQSQPFLTSVLGAAAALEQLARCAYVIAHPCAPSERSPEREVHLLYVLLKCYYSGDVPPHGLSHHWASNAAVLLNSIFTCRHQMAQMVIASGNAKGPAACAERMRQQEADACPTIGAPLQELVGAEDLAEAKAWWAPFVRPQENLNAWVKVCPLLVILAKMNGSLDLPIATIDEVWAAIHTLVCAGSWLHASPDGMLPPVEPSPLAGLRGASQVRAEHVTPTFIGKAGDGPDAKPALACIVGVLPMGFQQLLALLQGASSNKRVVVNYSHNFSFLVYRPSAAPDILTSKNKERSSKAISCLNVEGDEAAFGSRADKLAVCKLHRIAWRDNLDLVKPLCLRVAPPRPDKQRSRGDRAACDYCKERKRELDAEHLLTRQQVMADALMTRSILGEAAPVGDDGNAKPCDL
jgi:hypothetical protein